MQRATVAFMSRCRPIRRRVRGVLMPEHPAGVGAANLSKIEYK